jgi:hypothetical protein
MNVYIKENSWQAKIAAAKLGSESVAMVFGKTIHLHNVSKQDFIAHKEWLCHELVHVMQYQQYGFMGFLIRYMWESIKKGYHNNKFEVEARANEKNYDILKKFTLKQ